MAEEYKYRLRVRSHFEAAHRLEWHQKCHVLHGHTYHVELVIGSNGLNETGVVIDLAIAREILESNLPDHRCLSDIVDPASDAIIIRGWIDNPTVERIADKVLQDVRDTLFARGYGHYQPFPIELTIWETPTGGVTVT